MFFFLIELARRRTSKLPSLWETFCNINYLFEFCGSALKAPPCHPLSQNKNNAWMWTQISGRGWIWVHFSKSAIHLSSLQPEQRLIPPRSLIKQGRINNRCLRTVSGKRFLCTMGQAARHGLQLELKSSGKSVCMLAVSYELHWRSFCYTTLGKGMLQLSKLIVRVKSLWKTLLQRRKNAVSGNKSTLHPQLMPAHNFPSLNASQVDKKWNTFQASWKPM